MEKKNTTAFLCLKPNFKMHETAKPVSCGGNKMMRSQMAEACRSWVIVTNIPVIIIPRCSLKSLTLRIQINHFVHVVINPTLLTF